MSNNLIIVPVYPPHFHWAKNLLDSAPPTENIALGFSNHDEAYSFRHSFPYKKLIANVPSKEVGFIVKKKLDLLEQTYSHYDYISIIDAECQFLKPVTNYLKNIWNDNCFVANHSIDGARITKGAANFFNYNHNDDLYPWFNCIPVYKTDLLPGFFKWLYEKKEVLNFYGFEFLLFALYCRYELGMDWKVIEGKAWHGLVENGHEMVKISNKHLLSKIVWSTYQRDIEKYPNIRMLFHLDRYPLR